MIFNRLAIENIGVFRGRTEFDLTPSTKRSARRPIILFGGMNGSGKTTVFEAFKLALYGTGAFWPPLTRDQYVAEIRNRLSRHSATLADLNSCSVELELEHGGLGIRNRYTIHREWSFRNKAMKESLEVCRDGLPLGEVERSLWQDFVWDLIPPGLSRLFFFDGEKIQSLAEDESGALRLAESFRSLVGLDLVDRLAIDLDFIVAKELRKTGTSRIGKQLDQAHAQLEELKRKRSNLLSDRAKIQTDADLTASQVESKERRIAAEGGGWSRERERLIHSQSALATELQATESRLRELAAGVIPLAFAPDLVLRARRRIEEEVEGEQWLTASSYVRKRVQKRLSEYALQGGGVKGKPLDAAVARAVRTIIEDALVPPSALRKGRNLNQLSAREAANVLGWFEEASSRSSAEVRKLTAHHRELSLQQRDALQHLARAPSEVQLAPLMTEFNTLHSRLSELKVHLATFDTNLAHLDREIDAVSRTIEHLREEAYHQEKATTTLGTARKIGDVLREFQTSLTNARIAEITRTLQETFSSLSRKRGWLGGIRVDPKSFSVVLVDRHGQELPKERLAAGEKQIYAVALLWALAKASGRSLPFIIDTPLGRLDSSHRRNLVTSFLPVASDQVIVFSTDTEIDRPYFESLRPHIARTYHLVHDEGLGLTRFESGYFWRQETLTEVA